MSLTTDQVRTETEIVFKKQNYTEADIDTRDNSSKLSQKFGKNPLEDEFWNDCGKNLETDIRPNLISLTKPSESSNLTFDLKKSLPSTKTNISPIKTSENANRNILFTIDNKLKQLKLKYGEDVVDPDKNSEKLKNNEKSKKAMERSNMLYEQGKMKNEVHKIVTEKTLEIKRELELKECTFKPKINANLQKFINYNRNISKLNPRFVYDRQFNLMLNNKIKIEQTKNEQNRRENDHPFKPKLNRCRSSVFKPQDSVVNDFITRNFLIRQEKARREKVFKLSKLNDTVQLTTKFRKIHRSASADNSILYTRLNSSSNFGHAMKILHNDLTNTSIII